MFYVKISRCNIFNERFSDFATYFSLCSKSINHFYSLILNSHTREIIERTVQSQHTWYLNELDVYFSNLQHGYNKFWRGVTLYLSKDFSSDSHDRHNIKFFCDKILIISSLSNSREAAVTSMFKNTRRTHFISVRKLKASSESLTDEVLFFR